MDQERFDAITKTLASGISRRSVLRRLGAALGGTLALGAAHGAEAQPGRGGGKPQGRCADGFTNCRGTCVDIATNTEHCGACNTVCSGPASTCCGGTCTELGTTLNCSGCGDVCRTGPGVHDPAQVCQYQADLDRGRCCYETAVVFRVESREENPNSFCCSGNARELRYPEYVCF